MRLAARSQSNAESRPEMVSEPLFSFGSIGGFATDQASGRWGFTGKAPGKSVSF